MSRCVLERQYNKFCTDAERVFENKKKARRGSRSHHRNIDIDATSVKNRKGIPHGKRLSAGSCLWCPEVSYYAACHCAKSLQREREIVKWNSVLWRTSSQRKSDQVHTTTL